MAYFPCLGNTFASLPVEARQVLNLAAIFSTSITDVFTVLLNSTHLEETESCAFS